MSDEELTRAKILNLLDQIEAFLSEVKFQLSSSKGGYDDRKH